MHMEKKKKTPVKTGDKKEKELHNKATSGGGKNTNIGGQSGTMAGGKGGSSGSRGVSGSK